MNGYIKLKRSEETEELLRKDKNCFVLLTLAAMRARWQTGESLRGLRQGQALIGDHESCGLSRQEYRSALKRLEKYKIATIKATTKGTIVTIVNTSIFEICSDESNHQVNHHPTITQPSPNHHPTITQPLIKKDKKEKKVKNKESTRTPGDIARSFFEQAPLKAGSVYEEYRDALPPTELEKFVDYWTEPTKSGRQVRWETCKTFEVGRRIATWRRRADDRPEQRREVYFHKRGVPKVGMIADIDDSRIEYVASNYYLTESGKRYFIA